MNYLALENYGSAENPRADLEVFLATVAAPLVGGRDYAQKYLHCSRAVANRGHIPEELKEVYALAERAPLTGKQRSIWLANYLASFLW